MVWSFPINLTCLLSLFSSCLSILLTLYGCSSDILRSQFYSKLPDLLVLTSLLPPLSQCSLSFRIKNCFTEESTGTRLHNSVFLITVVFCIDFSPLQREVLLMRGEEKHLLMHNFQFYRNLSLF